MLWHIINNMRECNSDSKIDMDSILDYVHKILDQRGIVNTSEEEKT